MGYYIDKMSSGIKTTKKNKKSGIFGNIWGKTLKRLGWRKKKEDSPKEDSPKEDSPNTKIIKELEKIKPPTTNVAKEIKEHKNVISRLIKDIKKDAENIQKEKKNIEILNNVSRDVNALKLKKVEEIKELRHKAKLKTAEDNARILHGLNIPITTEQKDLKKLSELPPVPTKNPNKYNLEDELGDVPIAFIRHISYEKKRGGSSGGKKKSRKKCKK